MHFLAYSDIYIEENYSFSGQLDDITRMFKDIYMNDILVIYCIFWV